MKLSLWTAAHIRQGQETQILSPPSSSTLPPPLPQVHSPFVHLDVHSVMIFGVHLKQLGQTWLYLL